MSVKRRDKKNRVLHDGESQRADGRYVYKYVDISGKSKFVYSWKLVDTDTVPQGKRDCVSLRTQEKKIQKRLEVLLSGDVSKLRLIDCLELYFENKTNIKENTRCTHKNILSILRREDFCYLTVSNVTSPKAKKWFAKMQEDGRSYGSLNLIKSHMSSMFNQMIEDELVVKNPFSFKLTSVLRNDTKKRVGLTPREEDVFLKFVKCRYSKYYDEIYFLLNTGLRISEFCGLTFSDIDFDNKTIDINHQLLYYDGDYHVTSLKTESGERIIPMTEDLEECLRSMIKKRRRFEKECVVDGTSGFLSLTYGNNPTVERLWVSKLKTIVNRFNKENTVKLPNITPHTLRHTYCSKLVRNGVSLKTVQYLMGHSDVSLSLNVYAHIEFEDVKNEIMHKKNRN